MMNESAPTIVRQLFGLPLPSRTLTVVAKAGLCNRLKTLASGLTVAADTDRSFAMLWPRTAACGAGFDELFRNPYHVATVELEPAALTDLEMTALAGAKLDRVLHSPCTHVLASDFNWLVHPRNSRLQTAYHRRWATLINGLVPVDELSRQIETFRARHFAQTMIGVHLRRGDFLRDWPQYGQNIDCALLAVDHFLDSAPQAGILLCTDDGAIDPATAQPTQAEGVHSLFGKRYGERVVYTVPRSLDRQTVAAIQDALVELWLLRSVDYFVGTLRSTFSRMAIFGRSLPFIMCTATTPNSERTGRLIQAIGLGHVVQRTARMHFGYDLPFPIAWQWLWHLRAAPARRLRSIVRGMRD